MTFYRTTALLLSSAWLLTGCSVYVNIPAIEGDMAKHDPNSPDVRPVIVEALQAVATEANFKTQYAILLPEKTTARTYSAVVSRIGKQAVWPGNQSRGELPILEIRRIGIRAQDARVDIIRPLPGAQTQQADVNQPEQAAEPDSDAPYKHPVPEPATPGQVVTVSLNYHPMKGWVVQRIRAWKLPVETVLAP